jgi:hypothetical protein
METRYDAIIIGGGHNGLVAACYLGDAGKKVLILEKNESLGGASVSQQLFPDYDARISRYAYLVSLFPERLIRELGLKLRLRQRPISSYTPHGDGEGLLVSNENPELTEREIRKLGDGEWTGYQALMEKQRAFAGIVWESLLEPLKSRSAWEKVFRDAGRPELWRDFVERPIGELLETHFKSDLLRGIIFTDGKIGSNAGALDSSLLQNRTYLYHVIGNKTGEWLVPEGGMGRLTDQLAARARKSGVEWRLGAEVVETPPKKAAPAWRFGIGAPTSKSRPGTCSGMPPRPPAGGRILRASTRAPLSRSTCCWKSFPNPRTAGSRPKKLLPARSTSTKAIRSSKPPDTPHSGAGPPKPRPARSTATPSPTRRSLRMTSDGGATTR